MRSLALTMMITIGLLLVHEVAAQDVSPATTYRNDPAIAARTDTDPAVAALVAGTSACEATTNKVRARVR